MARASSHQDTNVRVQIRDKNRQTCWTRAQSLCWKSSSKANGLRSKTPFWIHFCKSAAICWFSASVFKNNNVSVWLVVIYDEFCGQDSNYVCFSKTSLCVVSETVWLIYVRPGLVYRTISGWARMKVASNQTLSEIWVSGWRVEERIAPLSTFKACHCLNLWWPLRLQFHHRITAEVECFRLASHIFLGGAPF